MGMNKKREQHYKATMQELLKELHSAGRLFLRLATCVPAEIRSGNEHPENCQDIQAAEKECSDTLIDLAKSVSEIHPCQINAYPATDGDIVKRLEAYHSRQEELEKLWLLFPGNSRKKAAQPMEILPWK